MCWIQMKILMYNTNILPNIYPIMTSREGDEDLIYV